MFQIKKTKMGFSNFFFLFPVKCFPLNVDNIYKTNELQDSLATSIECLVEKLSLNSFQIWV